MSTAAAHSPAVHPAVRWGVLLVAVAVLVYLPLGSSPFNNLQFTLIAVYAVAILGLDVVIGWAGQVSLGQSAFFGLGAYVTAVTVTSGLPLAVALVLSVLICAGFGALVAVPAVRLRGYALGMITLTLPVVAVPLAKRLESVTGGAQGMTVEIAAAPAWSGLDDDQWRYYVVLALAALTFLLVRNLLRGRYGRALATIRANEVVATAMGIPVRTYKVLAFTVAALCGGVAGFLYLIAVQFISPETLVLTISIFLLASLVVGGLRSQLGAVIGAAFYVLVPNLTAVNPERSSLYYGFALLAVLLFLPGGVSRAVLDGAGRLLRLGRSRRHADAPAEAPDAGTDAPPGRVPASRP